MKSISIISAFSLILFFSCQKQEPELGPTLPPFPTPGEYVPIFSPCDTSQGVATAKKLTANWKAGVTCRTVRSAGKDYWVFELTTCAGNNLLREFLGFGGVPNLNPLQKFPLKKFTNTVLEGWVDPTYATLLDDGDLMEDYYLPDTTATDSYFQIHIWDKANKRAEGSFSVALLVKEPHYNLKNPKRITFTSGKFWVKLPE